MMVVKNEMNDDVPVSDMRHAFRADVLISETSFKFRYIFKR